MLSAAHERGQDVPRCFFYGEIKGGHEGYLQLSWHSSSEDGVDCSPLIEDTFEGCFALCQMAFQCCGNPGAIGTSSGGASHEEWHRCMRNVCQICWRDSVQLCPLQLPGLYLQGCKILTGCLKLKTVHENSASGQLKCSKCDFLLSLNGWRKHNLCFMLHKLN